MLQILSTSNETSTGTELVQNGNFSQLGADLVENGLFDELGTDVITNGNFATDTDWTKGNGWSIAGKAISTQALGSEEVTNGDFSAAGINLVDNPNFTDTGSELVVNGDFLGKIAKNYGVRVGDLKKWNKLKDDKLKIGKRLIIFPKKFPKKQ